MCSSFARARSARRALTPSRVLRPAALREEQGQGGHEEGTRVHGGAHDQPGQLRRRHLGRQLDGRDEGREEERPVRAHGVGHGGWVRDTHGAGERARDDVGPRLAAKVEGGVLTGNSLRIKGFAHGAQLYKYHDKISAIDEKDENAALTLEVAPRGMATL